MLNVNILRDVARGAWFTRDILLRLYRHNTGNSISDLEPLRGKPEIFQRILDENALRLAVIIAGQGPEAFGMPEMFTPTQHINHNRALRKIVTIISDGRYSGVTYGAAVGHVTPESFNRGGILYLRTGDLLHLRLRRRKIDLLDTSAFAHGTLRLYPGTLSKTGKTRRTAPGPPAETPRLDRSLNLMTRLTDAAHGPCPSRCGNGRKVKPPGESLIFQPHGTETDGGSGNPLPDLRVIPRTGDHAITHWEVKPSRFPALKKKHPLIIRTLPKTTNDQPANRINFNLLIFIPLFFPSYFD